MNADKTELLTPDDIEIEKSNIRTLADQGNLEAAKSRFSLLIEKMKEQTVENAVLGGLFVWFAQVFMAAKSKFPVKKLIVLTFFLFSIGCGKITVVETIPAKLDTPANGYIFTISKEEYVAPKLFVQPYQHLVVNCYDQPCDAGIGNADYTAKYDGKNFLIDIITSDVSNKKTAKVNDHAYIVVRLANDAYTRQGQVFLTVTPLSESQKQTLIQEGKDNEFYSTVKFAVGFVLIVLALLFLVGLFSKIALEKGGYVLTPEDILNHADNKKSR